MSDIIGFDEVQIDEIVDTEEEAWGELAADQSTIEDRLKVHPEGFVGVISDDGKLVGHAYGIRYDHDDVDPRTWSEATNLSLHDSESDDLYVVSVGVAENHRGQGYGSRVLEGLHERAEDLGVETIYLGRRDTEGNKHFYESNGYEDVEKINDWWPEDDSSEGSGVMMKKEI